MSNYGIDFGDTVEACRTCGTFFMLSSNLLRNLFETNDQIMQQIRTEMATWKLEVNENDDFPKYMCTGCIYEFQKLFSFRHNCFQNQENLQYFYNLRKTNLLNIKTEIPDKPDDNIFIYVDDLDDNYDPSSVAPFHIPHVPIKEEIIQEATVPDEHYYASQTVEAAAQDIPITQTPVSTSSQLSDSSVNQQQETGHCEDNLEQSVQDGNDNGSKKKIRCKMCSHISPSAQSHRLHLKRIHQIRDLKCNVCGKEFQNSTQTRLNFHMKWHRLHRHQKCAQCSYYCDSRELLLEHQRKAHSRIKCTICGKNILNSKMDSHMQLHEIPAMEWNCEYCTDVFASEAECQQHKDMVHSVADNDVYEVPEAFHILCAFCEEQFTNTDDLKQHVLSKHDKIKKEMIPIESDYLPKEEPISDNEDEMQEKEEQSNNSDILGNINTKALANSQSTEDDLTSYDDDDDDNNSNLSNLDNCVNILSTRPNEYASDTFACAHCRATFPTITEMIQHNEFHKNKSQFKCHICSKSFELKFTLNRHLKKHTVAPF